jgi:hypothetical protein
LDLNDFNTPVARDVSCIGRVRLTARAIELMRLIAATEGMPPGGVDFVELAEKWPHGDRSLKTLIRRYGFDSEVDEGGGCAICFSLTVDEGKKGAPNRSYFRTVELTPSGYSVLTRLDETPKAAPASAPARTAVAAPPNEAKGYTAAEAVAAKAEIDARTDISKRSKASLKAHIARRTT